MTVKVRGPSELSYLVDAMRCFIPNAAMVQTRSFGPTSNNDLGKFTDPIVLIDDEVVKLSAILVRPSSSILKDGSAMLGLDQEIDQLLGPPLPCSDKDLESKDGTVIKPGDISVVYVCELPEIIVKLDPAKAMALGLKPGPKYRKLQVGNSVMSDKQNIMVHPSDVLGPSVPGPVVLLVDCPTPFHLQELLSIQSLTSYYSDLVDQQLDGAKSVNCIIHLTPSSVTKTATYQKWMKRFGGAQHIMAGHEMKNMQIPILKSSARVAARLNYLCPKFFPSPGFWSLQHLDDTNDSNENSGPKHCVVPAENLLKFHLRPYEKLGLDRSEVPSLVTNKEIVNELILEIPEIVDSLEQVSHLWDEASETGSAPTLKEIIMIEEPWRNVDMSIPNTNLAVQNINDSGEGPITLKSVSMNEDNHEPILPSCLENITREDMEIVLLGTGSSQPSKYRNVSSIYLNLFSKGGLLLDCGEGTLGQLKRRYGVKEADAIVSGLKCIWISHIHADHHTGLARILSRRCKLLTTREPLLVIGPQQLKRFLDAYQRLEDLDMQFLDCQQTTETSWDASSLVNTAGDVKKLKHLKQVLGELGLEALISIPVEHCQQAYGIVLKAAERKNASGKTIPGWKLAYSGDTMAPCQELIDASCGATILIHEATFEDGMMKEAKAKKHSTTKEAIGVGESAGAYRILLTHFSQRYPKIPVFDENHMHKTCIGFDLMSINIVDLPVLPKVLPYLKLLFRNEMMADEFDDAEVL